MVQMILMNGARVEVSQEDANEFITQILIPNPDWHHSGLLTKEEVLRYLECKSTGDELRKVARYILIYEENLTFTAFLFNKSEGHPDQGKEFNMPAVKKLRDLYQTVGDNSHTVLNISQIVAEMETTCLEIGADPL